MYLARVRGAPGTRSAHRKWGAPPRTSSPGSEADTLMVTGCEPRTAKVTRCSPGSTGTGVPQAAGESFDVSRLTSGSRAASGSGTRTTTRMSRGARSAMCARVNSLAVLSLVLQRLTERIAELRPGRRGLAFELVAVREVDERAAAPDRGAGSPRTSDTPRRSAWPRGGRARRRRAAGAICRSVSRLCACAPEAVARAVAAARAAVAAQRKRITRSSIYAW